MKNNNISRRNFIGKSCAAIGYTSMLSTLINLRAFAASAANNSALDRDYKALVFIMLNGGNDSYNMVIPRGNSEYNEYATTRSNLAIGQNDLLAINPITSDGREYGFNPALEGFQQLFESNRMALMSNVGTLIAPMTKQEYLNGSVDRPLGLFSHKDQQQHWQTGRPHERTHKGWGGRMADLLQSVNSNQEISMNISLSGINTFQYGEDIVPFVITAGGSISIADWLDNSDPFNTAKRTALSSLMEQDYYDIYKNTYKDTLNISNDAALYFQEIINALPPFTTPMPENNNLATELRMVAKTMAARDTMGFTKQTFYLRSGGWDHHGELLHHHGIKLTKLNEAIVYFNALLEELNIVDNVTTFNGSDFGRTLTSNGNGTDHAWGGNTFVMGGSVIGKDMYGNFPSLDLNGDHSLHNRGVMLPSTPTDLLFAELAQWFGVSNSDLDYIFPNLSNFYDTGSGVPPIGFMNI